MPHEVNITIIIEIIQVQLTFFATVCPPNKRQETRLLIPDNTPWFGTNGTTMRGS